MMRFCLAFTFQNEAHWLGLHLPKLLEAESIDGVVALDGGSDDDGVQILAEWEILSELDISIYERPFDWQFGKHKNALIEHCEAEGYEAMLLLDPDELMFPADIDHIAEVLKGDAAGVRFPTYHFEEDRYHWMPKFYPDTHIRAWRLDQSPVRYRGIVHEWPYQDGKLVQAERIEGHLYHYSGIQPRTARYRLKYINYARLQEKKGPLSELPAGVEIKGDYRPREVFEGQQPLDPDVIGARAPFEEAA